MEKSRDLVEILDALGYTGIDVGGLPGGKGVWRYLGITGIRCQGAIDYVPLKVPVLTFEPCQHHPIRFGDGQKPVGSGKSRRCHFPRDRLAALVPGGVLGDDGVDV